jgi:hypothetical protein
MGRDSKVAQVAVNWELHSNLPKRLRDFDDQAFKGEGDAFQQRQTQCPIAETPINMNKVKVQSQRVRVTLSGESPHNYRRIGSSGLNLACEGLLLRMRAEGHEGSPHRSITLAGKPQ